MGCISLFYNLFYMLENYGMLDPSNDTDLFALHYIFIPRISHQLDVFRQSYSHHRLHTVNNKKPFQLWIRGIPQESGDNTALQGILGEAISGVGLYSDLAMLNALSELNFPLVQSIYVVHRQHFYL